MSDLTPDKLRDALDAAGCRDHPGNPDPDCHVCIIDSAARRYLDMVRRDPVEEDYGPGKADALRVVREFVGGTGGETVDEVADIVADVLGDTFIDWHSHSPAEQWQRVFTLLSTLWEE